MKRSLLLSVPAVVLLAGLSLLLAGCGQQDVQQPREDDHAPPPSNRIDVPPMVRQNLGIRYVSVERRRIAATIRLPAVVELLPSGSCVYHAPFDGRVQLQVEPLQRVSAGDLLFTLSSPSWRRRQRELAQLASDIEITQTNLDAMQPLLAACEQHEASLQEAHRVTSDQVATLQQADRSVGGQAQKLAAARVELARFAADIADASEKHITTLTRIDELTTQLASRQRQSDLLLRATAAALDTPVERLTETVDDEPRWQTLDDVEVRATQAGVVDTITTANGTLLGELDHVLTTVDPDRIRCRAHALQSDLPRLRDGLPVHLVPVRASASVAPVAATLRLGLTGDATRRTFEVFAEPAGDERGFLRPGLAVFAEIVTSNPETDEELAIPRDAVLRDGIDRVFFRRDPKDPDRVIRVVADLGEHDGRWVAIKSGIMDGDEVVLDGAFELVLASSDRTPKGGHFHADGTWHEDH